MESIEIESRNSLPPSSYLIFSLPSFVLANILSNCFLPPSSNSQQPSHLLYYTDFQQTQIISDTGQDQNGCNNKFEEQKNRWYITLGVSIKQLEKNSKRILINQANLSPQEYIICLYRGLGLNPNSS